MKKVLFALICLYIVTLSLGGMPLEDRPSKKYWNPDPDRELIHTSRSSRPDSATGFDIQKYEIFLQINDVARTINGKVIATVLAEANLSSISYNLKHLNVSQVKVNNIVVNHSYNAAAGLIDIPLSVSAGQTFITEVEYYGSPQLSGPPYQIGMYFYTNSVFTISDPDAGRFWWPCYDHPWDKAVVDLHIRMRSDWKVAANGLRQAIVNNGDGTSTTTWLGSHPMTTYLVCITAGPYVEYNQVADGLPIMNFVLSSQYNNAVNDLASLPTIIGYFSDLFGEYPFEKYGHATVNMSTFAAMEHQTMTTLGSFIINGNNTYELIIAHELAHQWFGNAVSFLDFPDVWLSEGFATYSESLWVDKRDGWAAACAYVLSSYHQYYLSYENQAGPQIVYNPAFNSYFSPPSYEKGASVLHMLRLKMGDAAFFELLQTWYSTYRNHNVVTSEFQAMAEQISGLDLTQFFHQWIYSAGIPSLEYAIYTKTNPPTLKVVGKTTSPTATQFHIDFPIRISGTGISDSLLVQANPQGFSSILPYNNISAITNVEADPNNWVLLRNKTQSIPQISQCIGSSGVVLLDWMPFVNASGYNVYRRTLGGAWQLINPSPILETDYFDENVENGINYEYVIKALDSEAYESMPSNIVSATATAFGFANAFLVVDETRNGTGVGISPTDEMVDNFYQNVFSPVEYDNWDYDSQGAPTLQDLGNYRIVWWHDDDFTQNHLMDNIAIISGYILGGGKLIISGWKTAMVFDAAWWNRFAGGISPVYDNGAVMSSATSSIYPQLFPNAEKLNPVWNGMLPMVYSFSGVQNPIYFGDLLPGSNGYGLPIGFRHQQHGELVVLGFPLYFMMDESVRQFARELLSDLEPGLPIAENTVPPIKPDIKAYPNPWIHETNFNIKSASLPATIEIYNLRGQQVQKLNVIKDSAVWDGKDKSGKLQAPGIYLIRLNTPTGSKTIKTLKF